MRAIVLSALALLVATPAAAQQADMSAFTTGPVFEDFGPHASVEQTDPLPADTSLRHSFDVAAAAEEGRFNRGFESAARFINMHAANGIDPSQIEVAVVVHGGAVRDLLDGEDNAGAANVRAMLDHGVRFIVCGQSAAGLGISADDLIPGVEMALSAMTAHALLQQQGYTVNPF
ncbi:DsrE family protein [Aurantiacibacter poecillastricola]|uniref:DsrE family protein n=1 Tax=Aurantiacibacter poecillastricola TaxID=3064385 RepID=UPI00273DC0AB|nr:DsrE family protein [Aurantiacibacter sp. 219JJ12-13]MDP5261069.1 DsrE family protein [Aurantiacibacter sp. 219JJ12-13]